MAARLIMIVRHISDDGNGPELVSAADIEEMKIDTERYELEKSEEEKQHHKRIEEIDKRIDEIKSKGYNLIF